MNKNILKTGLQDFIKNFKDGDILSVAFKKSPFPGVSPAELVQQLEGRKRSAKKLPGWMNTPGIYYPKKLHLEQSSSERTAAFKAGLISGETVVDLTGGMGVDSLAFSSVCKQVFYCEKNEELARITQHNFGMFKRENISVHTGDGLEFLRNHPEQVASVYLDPSRRDVRGKRVNHPDAYDPPLNSLFPFLFEKARRVLIKTAPFLDIQEGIGLFPALREVYVIGLNNEVKELLWVLEPGKSTQPRIHAIELLPKTHETLEFTREEEAQSEVSLSPPLNYLYEPYAAFLKAGCFKSLSQRFGLQKLHAYTHLYTSNDLQDFPGRRFIIKKVIPYKPGSMPFKKANITTRNFPETVAEIRRRNRIKDGGALYLFFATDLKGNYIVIETEKVPKG